MTRNPDTASNSEKQPKYEKKVNDAAGLGVWTLRPHWTGTLTGQVVNLEYDSMLPGNV